APAGRRSRRGLAVRRPVLREERQPRHQARRIQAELHARAQRADLDRSDGACMSTGPFYGKYRGTVINNVDPMLLGRIQAMVPDVAGLVPSSWAMPCVPVAGINMGMFTVPPV